MGSWVQDSVAGWQSSFLSFSFPFSFPQQDEEVCEVGEFRSNMTVTAGRLLRLSCPLASSPACLLATTRVEWQWAPGRDQPRTAVTSQFDNPPYFYLLGVLPGQSGWYWCALGERQAGLSVTVVDPEEDSSPTLVSPASSEHTSPSAVTTLRVISSSILTATTEQSRAGRKESGESAESNEVEDGDDEELPTKSELEWMILKYIQPIHRQLADLHARLATVEEKLGGEGSGQRSN